MILQKNRRGSVLLITLIILTVATIYVGMVLSGTSIVAQNTNRSGKYQGAQAAAAGAVDYAYAVWLRRIASEHDLLNANDLSIPSPPSFPGFDYTEALQIQALDKYGVVTGTTPDMVVGPVPGYAGWWGRTYTYAATAKLRASGDVNAPIAGARRLFHYTEVPLFQCMFFFQDNLEIYNPAQISISGLIHTNGSFYLAAQQSSWLNILGQATYVNNCYTGSQCTGSNAPLGGYSISSPQPPTWVSGSSVQLSQVSTISAMGKDLDTLFDTSSSNNNINGGYRELIEPPDPSSADPDAISQRRLYNIAANTKNQTGSTGGMVIQVTGNGITANSVELTTLDSTTHLPVVIDSTKTTRIAVGSGASITTGTAAQTAIAAALSKKLGNSGSSTISGTAHLFDDRQSVPVNVVDVDMAKLQSAIASYVQNFSNVVYIYDNSAASYNTVTTSSNTQSHVVTSSTATTPTENTVRLLNGYNITGSNGLTIASLNPVYIQGDFNTSGTNTLAPLSNTTGTASNTASGYTSKPTSIVADAITLLSNSWDDKNSCTVSTSTVTSGSIATTSTSIARTSTSSRNAGSTTYNVALLGGYMPSTSSNYSGGAINYPRFLEDWTSDNCVYYGSMVELFPSKVATAPWRDTNLTNTFYKPPNRFYNFDTKFSSKSPPGSVSAIVLSRGLWSKY